VQGIEQGKLDMIKNLLLAGGAEGVICQAAQLTAEQLAQVDASTSGRPKTRIKWDC